MKPMLAVLLVLAMPAAADAACLNVYGCQNSHRIDLGGPRLYDPNVVTKQAYERQQRRVQQWPAVTFNPVQPRPAPYAPAFGRNRTCTGFSFGAGGC